MQQLICHLVGDYVLQNHWMATNKVKSWLPAIVHATVYMMPFCLLQPSNVAMLAMWSTHLLIDRFRLARYWVEFWGVGNTGELWLILWTGPYLPRSGKMEEKDRAPDFLAVWLLIIVDNTAHLAINFLCLEYL